MTTNRTEIARPTVLLVTTCRWQFAARLAMALSAAGCEVEGCMPAGHPMEVVAALRRSYRYRALAPLASLAQAIAHCSPDLVIPCDDRATAHLHALHASASDPGVRALIARSLGDPQHYGITTSRQALTAVASALSIPAPGTEAVTDPAQLRAVLARLGFPAFLKADGSSGGTGVKLITHFEDAERAFHTLAAPPALPRVLKRTLLDRDPTLLLPLLRRHRAAVSVQRHIAGHDANSASFCWQGEVLAHINVEVLRTRYATGPSTVVRVIENAEMTAAAHALARSLHLSGFFGLDFMIEERTGTPFLIEMNPRATQITHLALGAGRDLAAAAAAALTRQPVQPRPIAASADTIALFPQEWQQDAHSPHLRTAYHDVPWEEPALVRLAMKSQPRWQRWLTQEHWHALRHHIPEPLHEPLADAGDPLLRQ